MNLLFGQIRHLFVEQYGGTTYEAHLEQLGSSLSHRCFRDRHDEHTLGDFEVTETAYFICSKRKPAEFGGT